MGVAKPQTAASGQAPTKKGKKDPLRPQPAWLFPPDEENPVLNPQPKSEARIQKEKEERLAAIDYLKHRSVSAPMKPAPPGELLQLVGAFLTSYGFNSSSRVFTVEWKARKKLDDWNHEIGRKFDKRTSSLLQVYQQWDRELRQDQEAEAASSDTSSEDEASSATDSDSEAKKTPKKSKKIKKTAAGETFDSSDSASDSDSDSSDDDGPAKKSPKVLEKSAAAVNGVKRKTSSSDSDSDSSSDTGSDSSDSDANTSVKRRKVDIHIQSSESNKSAKTTVVVPAHEKAQKTAASHSSSDSDSSDDSSGSDSSSDADSGTKKKPTKAPKTDVKGTRGGSKTSTDSSHTLNGEPAQQQTKTAAKKPSTSSSSDSDSDSSSASSDSDDSSSESAAASAKTSVKETASKQKRKRSKSPQSAQATPNSTAADGKVRKHSNVPFSRIPKDTVVDPRLSSNAYVPYDYAQKAHEDLIITKGKGFTKEKNKKKRGSYRGGLIDTAGGKGIKFED